MQRTWTTRTSQSWTRAQQFWVCFFSGTHKMRGPPPAPKTGTLQKRKGGVLFFFSFFLFLAFGFLVSWLLGFSVYAAFGGFGFSHPVLSRFLTRLSGFCTLSLVLASASRILSITSSSLFESSLLRTSWGGFPPATHPLLFRLFAEIKLQP